MAYKIDAGGGPRVGRVLVFDIETVPDLDTARMLLCAGPDVPDEEVRQLAGERHASNGKSGKKPAEAFLKPVLHKVVCIAALSAARTGPRGAWAVERLGVLHTEEICEREIIARFAEALAGTPGPVLVGFNTSGFDLPVLRYRAMALGVCAGPMHRGNGRDYWKRYTQDHVDLCDILSNFNSNNKPKLVEVAALVGVPAKTGGIDGSQVETYVANGRLREVANYCETDVASLYLVYLRWQLAIGELDEDTYALSAKSFREGLVRRLDRCPHLRPYAA